MRLEAADERPRTSSALRAGSLRSDVPRRPALLYKRVYDRVNHSFGPPPADASPSLCRPTWISLLLTERCNSRCVHCDIWKNRGKEASSRRRSSGKPYSRETPSLARTGARLHHRAARPSSCRTRSTSCATASALGLLMEVLTHGYWNDQTRIEELARANPWRITISIDGTRRGSLEDPWPKGLRRRTFGSDRDPAPPDREREGLSYSILLKTVVMRAQPRRARPIARFAASRGVEVFYQPIEQNYNTPRGPALVRRTARTGRTTRSGRCAAVHGAPRAEAIAASRSRTARQQLEVMIPYFRDPAALRVATQSHTAHDRSLAAPRCRCSRSRRTATSRSALRRSPSATSRRRPLRQIWAQRPRWWVSGCCLEHRLTAEERLAASSLLSG